MADEVVGYTKRWYLISYKPGGEVLFVWDKSATNINADSLAERAGIEHNGGHEIRPASFTEIAEYLDAGAPAPKGRHE